MNCGLIAAARRRNAAYVETGTLGTTSGSIAYSFAGGDYINVWDETVPAGGIWFKKVKLLMQEVSSGAHIRPVIYTGTGSGATIIVQGQDIALSAQANSSPGVLVEIDFRSDGAATFLAAGAIGLAIHASGTQIDVKADTGTVHWVSDTYSDGPVTPLGSTSTSSRTPVVYLPYSTSGP
jgi:hypothetical protein